MQSDTKRTIAHILIGIVVGLASRYAADYLYNTMRRGGLTPRMPFVHEDSKGNLRRTDVYLIPFVGFSDIAAAQFAEGLSHDLGIVVKATGLVPLPEQAKDTQRDQFVADKLYPSIYQVSTTLGDTTPQTAYIAILADDMYPEHSSWNFCLAVNFVNRTSIIATDRLLPNGTIKNEAASKIYGERLYKLLKRTIGLQFYGYERSYDPRSLMFSPLMRVDALDQMSKEFGLSEQARAQVPSKAAAAGAP